MWSLDALHSFPHNGIVAGNGRVYCLDRLPKSAEDKRRRRGLPLPEGYRIVALEAGTGKKIWEIEEGITGSWLSYSAGHDILLQAGARAGDRIQDEVCQGHDCLCRGQRTGEVVQAHLELHRSLHSS